MATTLVWDASPLVHASLVERLDVLGDLAAGPRDAPWRHVTTAAVAEELTRHGGALPGWLSVVNVDGLVELTSLATWVGRVSQQRHSLGEATVLAWAEVHAAVAVVDDASARRVARRHGADVHGLLWVAGQAVTQGRWSAVAVSGFVDRMIESGARYPFTVGRFVDWAIDNGLLTPDVRSQETVVGSHQVVSTPSEGT